MTNMHCNEQRVITDVLSLLLVLWILFRLWKVQGMVGEEFAGWIFQGESKRCNNRRCGWRGQEEEPTTRWQRNAEAKESQRRRPEEGVRFESSTRQKEECHRRHRAQFFRYVITIAIAIQHVSFDSNILSMTQCQHSLYPQTLIWK